MSTRNRQLLDLAHGLPCTFKFPHVCNGPGVPCRANWQAFGRGFSFRSGELFSAAGCPAAHHEIDHGHSLSAEAKFWEWLHAHVSTMRMLWDQGLIQVVQ